MESSTLRWPCERNRVPRDRAQGLCPGTGSSSRSQLPTRLGELSCRSREREMPSAMPAGASRGDTSVGLRWSPRPRITQGQKTCSPNKRHLLYKLRRTGRPWAPTAYQRSRFCFAAHKAVATSYRLYVTQGQGSRATTKTEGTSWEWSPPWWRRAHDPWRSSSSSAWPLERFLPSPTVRTRKVATSVLLFCFWRIDSGWY